MVFRIALDVIRRKWKAIAWAVFQLGFFTRTAMQAFPSTDWIAAAMAGSYFLSIPPGIALKSRELYQLPVSRRQWWLARWWLSTIGGTLVVLVAAMLAIRFAHLPRPPAEEIWLGALFTLAYCGCVTAFHATAVGRSGDAPATLGRGAAYLPVMLLLVAAPFELVHLLPHRFADIRRASIIGVAAAIGIFIWGFLHAPAIEARPGIRRLSRSAKPPRAASGTLSFTNRLSGPSLALWDECRKHVYTFTAVFAAGIGCWAVASLFRAVPTLGQTLNYADVLPFASHTAHDTEPITWSALFFASTLTEPWMFRSIRPMRTLPLSATALSCLPLALALISTSILWMVLLVIHLAVLHSLPVSPRTDLFFAFAALIAMSHVIHFTIPGPVMVRGMATSLPMFMVFAIYILLLGSWRTSVVQPAMLLGGLAALGGSFSMMRYSLTRSSSMYRQPAVVTRFH